MRSMTGYGIGEATYGEGRVVVEARSVNHRFLDVRVRLPSAVADHTFFLEQTARQRLERGRFDIALQLEGHATPVALDRARARALFNELSALRDELSPGAEVPFGVLGAFGDLLGASSRHDGELFRGAATRALEAALVALDDMRQREGTELAGDIERRLEAVARHADAIFQRAPEVAKVQAARLRERIDKLLEGTGAALDAGRLETEVALLADRGDVSEEVVRLKSHVQQARALLDADGPVGRRLDFLVQEMGREANTVGAKSQDVACSHTAVELKSELNRIREQVQNVE